MRKFLVNVNGASYEVMVEEINGAAAPVAAPAPVAAAPAAAPVAAAPAAAPVAAAAGQESVESPMPGNILAINVKAGDAVKKGAVLMILEAMKMENSITSDVAGTIKQILVQEGDNVATDAILVEVEE